MSLAGAPLLSLRDVRMSFWRGVREFVVLDGASFALESHDFACVIGERAVGKTTLLEIAAGLRAPDAGQVLYAGQDFAGMSRRARTRLRRAEIACVWSRGIPTGPDGTVLDHVMLPLIGAGVRRSQRRRAALEMLERVGATDWAQANLHELSDAERARVALAQAGVRRPRLMIVDEITDTLDLIERNTLLAVLKRFASDGVTVLLTAADGHGAAGCNRVFQLSEGRLVGGRPRALGEVIAFPAAAPRAGDQPG